MITVTYSGLGSSLYEGGASMQYDNHYVGAIMANWTRGVAKVQIRAAGPVGRHTIEVDRRDQLRLPQPPAVADPVGDREELHVHRHEGPRPPEEPAGLAGLGLADAGCEDHAGRCRGGAAGTATARSASTSGPVMSKVDVSASGLAPSTPVSLVWSTVVGNRVNCTRHLLELRLRSARHGHGGADGTLTSNVAGPGRARRLARDPAAAERRGEGAGAVLRQAQHRRQRRLEADG